MTPFPPLTQGPPAAKRGRAGHDLGLPKQELPRGKVFLLEESTDAQPDLQGSDEQMFSPVSTSQANRHSLMTARFQALSLMLGRQMKKTEPMPLGGW